MAGIGIIVSGNVLGYSDANPLPTTVDMVDLYNKRAINTPMYGHNEILSMLDNFKNRHAYTFSQDGDGELDKLSPIGMAYDEMKKTTENMSSPYRTVVPTVRTQHSDSDSSDVENVMKLLNDSILSV